MEYIIENLTKREIDIMESSDIEWCPDDISSDSTDIVVFNKKDLDKTLFNKAKKNKRVKTDEEAKQIAVDSRKLMDEYSKIKYKT